MKIAFLFDNLGPYHIARLNAVAKVADIACVQGHSRSNEYDWGEQRMCDFMLITLFDGGETKLTTQKTLPNKLFRELDRLSPHVVFVPGWNTVQAIAGALWSLNHNVPYFVMSASQEIDFIRNPVIEAMKSWFLGFSAGAIVGGARQKAYCVKLGLAAEDIRIGYDVIDNDHFTAKANSDECGAFNFLLVARLVEKKNIELLLECLAALVNSCEYEKVVTLRIAGDGPLKGRLVEKATELNIIDNVTFLGHVKYEALPALYASSSCFVLPSSIEQWGLVVNEAMSSGLPVLVSSHCGCVDDLVCHGENGFVFESGNADSLLTFMSALVTAGSNELHRMSERSSEIIRRYSPCTFQQGVISLTRSPARLQYGKRVMGLCFLSLLLILKKYLSFQRLRVG